MIRLSSYIITFALGTYSGMKIQKKYGLLASTKDEAKQKLELMKTDLNEKKDEFVEWIQKDETKEKFESMKTDLNEKKDDFVEWVQKDDRVEILKNKARDKIEEIKKKKE